VKRATGYQMLYVVVFVLMFNDMRYEMIVGFVDIGRIVNHHCLNFLFIVQIIQDRPDQVVLPAI
jgi:hypothetical protein